MVVRAAKAHLNDWLVLIVDDHPDNLRLAEQALRFHGAQVFAAANGREAIEMMRRVRPTLVLLDLSMPIMSGWDLFDWMKHSRRFSKVPVVAVTAHAMHDDRKKVMDKGFDGYIPKPYDILSLVVQLQDIMTAAAEKAH